MYPDLSYFLNDIIGLNVNSPFSYIKTYGTLLFLSLFIVSWLAKAKLRELELLGLAIPIKVRTRKKKFNILLSLLELVIAFVIGYKATYVLASINVFSIGAWFSLKGYVIGGVTALIADVFIQRFALKINNDKAKRGEVEIVHLHQRMPTLVILCAIFGVIGHKAIVLIENLDQFLVSPLETYLNTGNAFYGALIGIFIGVCFFCRMYHIPILHLLDAIAMGAFFAYSIGRFGCHIVGDGCWGIVNVEPKPRFWVFPDWSWSFDYPHNIINKGVHIANCSRDYCYQLPNPVYPTSLYECILSALFGIVIWACRKKIKNAGIIFSLFIGLNGASRFLIGFIRESKIYDLMGFSLSQAQIVGLVLAFSGIILLVLLNRWNKPTIDDIAVR